MTARRLAVFVLLLSVVSAACGARLSDEQRTAAIGAKAGGSGGGGTEAAAGSLTDTGAADTGDGSTGGDAGGASGGSSGSPSAGPSAATPSGGSGGSGSSGQSGAAAKCKAGSDTSDPGITNKQVTIAVASDITGPSPGLFKSTHEAVQSYANYVNSTGGVCGRSLKVLKLDTKTDSGGNRAAILDACNKAFALVGSMSAFDDGGAQAIDDCKIPDISAIPTSPERVGAEWAYPVFPNRQDLLAVGQSTYIKNNFGDPVIKKAAILWLNATVTRNNAQARQKAWESVGFDFVYEKEVQVLEANYTPYVQDMKDQGVEYVTMVADNNSISRLVKAAKQQGWSPKVWDWDSVAYDPGFLELAGDAAEGNYVFVNTKMLEESGANAEMALYSDWLAKSAPGSEADYFGIYAWSATAMFVETMVGLGPDPTRQALLDKLKATASWDGHTIHGAQKVGSKTPTTCFMYMQIKGGKFVRAYPEAANSLDCDLAGHAKV